MADGTVQVGDLRLHYQAWGMAGHPTLVLVHGLGSSCHIWDLVAPILADRYHVLALDQRGHGESDQPDDGYDFPTIVADLAGFLDALDVRERAVLVGHSWGASVVLRFATTFPDRAAGIVLVDGGTTSPGDGMSWEQTLERLTPPDIDGMRWQDLRERMASSNGIYRDPRVETVQRSLFHIDADGRLRRRLRIPNHLRILRALWEERPAELLSQVRCPILLLPARQASDEAEWLASKARGVELAHRLQPAVRVRWFDDTIHDVPLQRPAELADEILAFADDLHPGGAVG